MKKNGFTLVELLAVIAILAIVLVMFVPSLLNSINGRKEESLNKVYDIIETAARNYVMDYNINIPSKIELQDLCEATYIECPVINPVVDDELGGYVFVGNDYYYSEKKEINFTVDLDQGTDNVDYNTKYEPGTIIELEVPQKTSYLFDGWEVEKGNSYVFDNKVMIGTEDTVIKAKWIQLIAQALYIEEDNTLYFIKQE